VIIFLYYNYYFVFTFGRPYSSTSERDSGNTVQRIGRQTDMTDRNRKKAMV